MLPDYSCCEKSSEFSPVCIQILWEVGIPHSRVACTKQCVSVLGICANFLEGSDEMMDSCVPFLRR